MPKNTITQTLAEVTKLSYDPRKIPDLDKLAEMCGEVAEHLSVFGNSADEKQIEQLSGIAKQRGATSAESLRLVLSRGAATLAKRSDEKRPIDKTQ